MNTTASERRHRSALTAKARRDKGVAFERAVADAFTAAGFQVRGLESGGDHFAVHAGGLTLRVEAKRHERLRIPEWLEQLAKDRVQGCLDVLVFRQSRRQAYVVQPLEEWLELAGKAARRD
jgi:Holliday junction resolvase